MAPTKTDKYVCTRCFGDSDLKQFVNGLGKRPGCSFCKDRTALTGPLDDICEFIGSHIERHYGRAENKLPFIDGEYVGSTYGTDELLNDHIYLELPRDHSGLLLTALVNGIGDQTWCDEDWLSLPLDELLTSYWEQFCSTVKHQRRFFFHRIGEMESNHPEGQSLLSFLYQLCGLADELGLIRIRAAGYVFFRARGRKAGQKYVTPTELGPPPAERSVTSNRMNPPGIPMFYAAENKKLACAEAHELLLSVGKFTTERDIRIMDLVKLAPIPGFFSDTSPDKLRAMIFFNQFARTIAQPVSGDDRTHIDYIPTQIFTEFVRDYDFYGGSIDGLRYPSATGVAGANIVLFATQEDVVGAGAAFAKRSKNAPWIRLVRATSIERGL